MGGSSQACLFCDTQAGGAKPPPLPAQGFPLLPVAFCGPGPWEGLPRRLPAPRPLTRPCGRRALRLLPLGRGVGGCCVLSPLGWSSIFPLYC